MQRKTSIKTIITVVVVVAFYIAAMACDTTESVPSTNYPSKDTGMTDSADNTDMAMIEITDKQQ
ncbi:MAG: hypothetical protein K2H74_07490 [Paramuribaculum sp.]|nr:hypothetical protein [Paramuribaculum sp.]